MLEINDLRNKCYDENIVITKHANIRLRERGITIENIKQVIMSGEIIRQYVYDKPFPSCLMLGIINNNKHIHVVISSDNDFLYIITAYYPDVNYWDSSFVNRREPLS